MHFVIVYFKDEYSFLIEMNWMHDAFTKGFTYSSLNCDFVSEGNISTEDNFLSYDIELLTSKLSD